MPHNFFPLSAGACLVAGALLAASFVTAADDSANANDAKPTAAEDVYRREAERLVGGIDLEVYRDDAWSKVKRIAKPLLHFGDATRGHDRGSVWAWGETGRPVAVLELWQDASDRDRWYCSLANTSGGKVRAARAGTPWWRENESACELKDVPGAPAPGDAGQRPRQRKVLAEKFAGHQFWDPDNSRYELRRLDRPLHTYRDEAGGLLEGGLYVFANGTNPEILLFVEARVLPADKLKAAWQFAVGRSSHAELHLDYDGKEVFTGPRGHALSGPRNPYWITALAATPVAEPKP